VSKIVPFLDSLNNSQAFILWIGSGYYEDLTNWKIWIASEALSGRYIYEFFYSRQPNGLDGFIEDTLTGEKFALDPWADVYDGPLAD